MGHLILSQGFKTSNSGNKSLKHHKNIYLPSFHENILHIIRNVFKITQSGMTDSFIYLKVPAFPHQWRPETHLPDEIQVT